MLFKILLAEVIGTLIIIAFFQSALKGNNIENRLNQMEDEIQSK